MTVEQYTEPLHFSDGEAWVPDQRPRDFGQNGISAAHARYVRIGADATALYLENRRNGLPAIQPEKHPDVVAALAVYDDLYKNSELRSRFG